MSTEAVVALLFLAAGLAVVADALRAKLARAVSRAAEAETRATMAELRAAGAEQRAATAASALSSTNAAAAVQRSGHEAAQQRADFDHARTIEALEAAWAHVRGRNEFLERALLEAFSPGLARRADPSQPSPVKPIVGPDADDEPNAEDGVEMPPV